MPFLVPCLCFIRDREVLLPPYVSFVSVKCGLLVFHSCAAAASRSEIARCSSQAAVDQHRREEAAAAAKAAELSSLKAAAFRKYESAKGLRALLTRLGFECPAYTGDEKILQRVYLRATNKHHPDKWMSGTLRELAEAQAVTSLLSEAWTEIIGGRRVD